MKVEVTCGSCGKYLGYYFTPQFGVDSSGENQKQVDIDCRACNKFYDKNCDKCGRNDINKDGKCRRCGNIHKL